MKHSAKLLTTLLDVSNLVSSTMELKPLLEAILDKLSNIIEYDSAGVYILSGSQMRAIAYRSRLKAQRSEISLPPSEIKTLVSDKRPVVIDGRIMALPMVSKNNVIGLLVLKHDETGYYKQHHIEPGLAFANQAAIEYENAKLYNETVKKADEIRTMFNIQQAITSRLELDVVLKLIADEARRLTNAHYTAVFLVDGESLVLSVFSGEQHDGLLGLKLPVSGSDIGDSLKKNESVIIDFSKADEKPEGKFIKIINMYNCICVPLLAGTRAVGAIAAFSRNKDEFDSEDERIFNMFAPSAVIGIENARLYKEEKLRHLEDEQRRHVAEALRDILAVLNSDHSHEEILDFIAKEAARILSADSAAIYKLNADKKTLVVEAASNLPRLVPESATLDAEKSFHGKAFLGRKPVVANSDPDGMCLNCEGIIAVPLICIGEVYGGIALYIKREEGKAARSISKEDIDLAITFADQTALAIENTKLRNKAEEMAVAAERNRLARDLHDSVTQTLFSASLIAEVLPKIWEKNPENGLKRLEEIRQLTRGALAEMRTLLFELRPATLVEAPLGELLKQLSEAVTGRGRIPVSLSIKATEELPVEVKISFYRIAQEALNNIAKHSNAKKAEVELCVSKAGMSDAIDARLCITDDGKGFDPSKVTSEHLGIGIMGERAEAIGAVLTLVSSEEEGTTVCLTWSNKKKKK